MTFTVFARKQDNKEDEEAQRRDAVHQSMRVAVAQIAHASALREKVIVSSTLIDYVTALAEVKVNVYVHVTCTPTHIHRYACASVRARGAWSQRIPGFSYVYAHVYVR